MRFPDILYSQVDLELIYNRILPELLDAEYTSLLSSLFLMFIAECLQSRNRGRRQKQTSPS